MKFKSVLINANISIRNGFDINLVESGRFMEILLGENAGFCYGVKRAVEGAELETKNTEGKIYCLGEIVHNKEVINDLKEKGLRFIENISEADATTIIRAHGVPKEVYKYADENEIILKDYTCPNVLKIHKLAEEYSSNGYFIILFGSKKHPENIGTISYCGEYYFVAENEDELFLAIDEIKHKKFNKILVLSQTTFSLENFDTFQEILKNELNKGIELIIKNTICKATEIRQKETEDLSKKVDCMIIIGGKNSSNTKKLYDIANKNCAYAICIETVNELDKRLLDGVEKIGIMAGASTPRKSIDEVYEILHF